MAKFPSYYDIAYESILCELEYVDSPTRVKRRQSYTNSDIKLKKKPFDNFSTKLDDLYDVDDSVESEINDDTKKAPEQVELDSYLQLVDGKDEGDEFHVLNY
ncbi:unnamed protein product [Didymodactylos carnosus]|uniref:Uncharacterized protein n=1 Tax=Didymodactylos carnosus TaxID=1234261 RepID=A0A8S2UF09_9BILA|nr:unnamed protein product [Didymodactylos carnosus]CAF4333084.1 unnamed protein product [Didymodactylos carnosus]